MTTRRLLALLTVGLAVMVTMARGRAGEADAPGTVRYEVRGVITAAPADGRVMVAHEAIGAYMPAMTMPFALDPADTPPALRPGDRVRFTLEVAGVDTRALGFAVIGHDETVAAALAAPSARTASRLRPGDALPSFSLVTQSGAAFTADALRGHRTAITFIFTRCPQPEFCPLMVKRFQQIQRELQRDATLGDVRLLAVTLDPQFDVPPVLQAYATAMHADPARWTFLTGTPDAVRTLTRAFAVHTETNGVLLDHTLATAVLDAEGRVVEIWRGNHWRADQVLASLRGIATGRPPRT